MNILFIGDIAGRYEELKELVGKFPNHRIIALGDLQDRGPDSKKVLDFLMQNNIEALYGNHEEMFLDFITNDFYTQDFWLTFIMNGGIPTLRSYVDFDEDDLVKRTSMYYHIYTRTYEYRYDFRYKPKDFFKTESYKKNKNFVYKLLNDLNIIRSKIDKKYINYIKSLPRYIKEKDFLATHAPVIEDFANVNVYGSNFLWNRIPPIERPYNQIYGHNTKKSFKQFSKTFSCCVDDSGNNRLNALDYSTKQFVFVEYKD